MTVTAVGTVTSGFGTGKDFISLPGYARQFEELLGYEPYPGTLNLELDAPVDDELASLDPIRVSEWESDGESFGAVNCYPATIVDVDDSVPIHVIVPDRTDHDTSTVELISPVRLRDEFDLSEQQAVEICIGTDCD
jgi:riboflavin kinase